MLGNGNLRMTESLGRLDNRFDDPFVRMTEITHANPAAKVHQGPTAFRVHRETLARRDGQLREGLLDSVTEPRRRAD